MTDAELIEAYLTHLKWRNRAQTTIDIRKQYLTALTNELGPFSKIKAKVLQAWMADPARSLQASSQGTYLACYHSFYEWAVKAGHLKKDPTAKIDKPAAKKGEPHPINTADLEKALANADALTRCWLSLAAYAGCRCQEIALMRREDVRDAEKRLLIAFGKGSKQRWVRLNPKVIEALEAWGMPENGRLWEITPAQMSKALGSYLHGLDAKRVDGEPATAHSLRHWFGTELYRKTKDLRLVQIAMGHSSPQTTAGYAAPDMEAAAGYIDSL